MLSLAISLAVPSFGNRLLNNYCMPSTKPVAGVLQWEGQTELCSHEAHRRVGEAERETII